MLHLGPQFVGGGMATKDLLVLAGQPLHGVVDEAALHGLDNFVGMEPRSLFVRPGPAAAPVGEQVAGVGDLDDVAHGFHLRSVIPPASALVGWPS